MIIVPAFYLQDGRLIRPTPFSTADEVFGGSVVDAVRAFLSKTNARAFYLIDVNGAAASEPSLSVAAEVLAAGSTEVLLEGGLDELRACMEIAARGIHPVASEAILADDRIEDSVAAALLERSPVNVLLGLRGDDDQLFERAAHGIERGIWGIVHHSTNANMALALDRRCGEMPVYLREPGADPNLIEDVIAHHRRLYAGAARRVIVDGEWYLDYNTMNAPFDLLQ